MPLAFVGSADGDHTYHVGGDRLPTSVTVLDACPYAKVPRFTPEQRQVAARTGNDSGSLATTRYLTLSDPPTNAELSKDLAYVLLKSHYATLPAGASARVLSTGIDPLRLELTLPADTVPVRLAIGMANVVASHTEVSDPNYPLAALFDSQSDPFALDEAVGPLYHVMPNNIVGFVVLDLAVLTPISIVSFYMGPYRLYRTPRNYRVFSGTSASGPWILVGQLNSEAENLPQFATFQVEAPTITQYLRLEFDSPHNANAATMNLYEITLDVNVPNHRAAVVGLDTGLVTALGGRVVQPTPFQFNDVLDQTNVRGRASNWGSPRPGWKRGRPPIGGLAPWYISVTKRCRQRPPSSYST
jgi:hypothetical protein